MAWHRRALALQPRAAQAYANAGRTSLAAGDLVAAQEYYTDAVGLDPAHCESRAGLARVLAASADTAGASDLLRALRDDGCGEALVGDLSAALTSAGLTSSEATEEDQ